MTNWTFITYYRHLPQLLVRGDNIILMSRDSDSNYGYRKMKTKLIAADASRAVAAKVPNILKIVRKLEKISSSKKKEKLGILAYNESSSKRSDVSIINNNRSDCNIEYDTASTSLRSLKSHDRDERLYSGDHDQPSRTFRETIVSDQVCFQRLDDYNEFGMGPGREDGTSNRLSPTEENINCDYIKLFWERNICFLPSGLIDYWFHLPSQGPYQTHCSHQAVENILDQRLSSP